MLMSIRIYKHDYWYLIGCRTSLNACMRHDECICASIIDAADHCSVLFYYRIHRRSIKKSAASPLPSHITKESLPLEAAWPSYASLTNTRYRFKPSFRIPGNLLPSVLTDNPDLSTAPEMKDAIALFNPCSTCWNCACGSTQTTIARCVCNDMKITELQDEVKVQKIVISHQHHAISTNWSLSVAETIKKNSTFKKDAKLLTEAKNQVELLEEQARLLQEQLMEKHRKIVDLLSENEELQVFKDNTLAQDMCFSEKIKKCCATCQDKFQ